LPRLLAFVPCERIIKEGDTNNLSAISMFTKLSVQLPARDKPSTVAMPWQVLVVWRRETEEELRTTYRQSCEIVAPDGHVLRTLTTEFSMATDIVNTLFLVRGFPLAPGGGGRYLLRLSLGESGKDLAEIATYPLTVSFEPPTDSGSEVRTS
jgi:hypothetical protein